MEWKADFYKVQNAIDELDDFLDENPVDEPYATVDDVNNNFNRAKKLQLDLKNVSTMPINFCNNEYMINV